MIDLDAGNVREQDELIRKNKNKDKFNNQFKLIKLFQYNQKTVNG